ncbi:MAG TPA: AAA family ATPase, partial [Longimicrobiales bacterium]|nr:AAA family ATPase [Longimicrobiales bacterium]
MLVSLHLLDQTELCDREGLARLPLGKPLALVVYLRVSGKAVHRTDLTELFWSSSPKRARASLRNALWTIRDRLDEDVIETDGDLVRANPDLISLDLDDLRHALKAGDAAEAIDLWGEGLLPDLAITDAPGWDRWVEELHDEISEPLRITVEETARAAETDEARRYRAFLATTFPWKSGYWTAWVQTCLDAADVACAEEALTAARRHPLNDEVQSELDELAERVEAARRAVSRSDEDRRLELPMVGRSRVLARLRKHARQPAGPPFIAITGAAGVGKTRLVNEFLLGETDATIVRSAAFEADARTPWSLVVSLAHELAGQEGAAGISMQSANALARVAPSLAPVLGASPEIERADGRMQAVTVADAFFDLVEAVAEQQRLILFIDDLHWADTVSRDVLLRMGRMTRTDLRVVVTCRSGDADRNTIAAIQMQTERQWAVREELRNLRRGEVREAIALAITLEPPRLLEPLLDRVYDISAGNPLVLNSLLQEMKTTDRLTWREPDGWVLVIDRIDDLTVPDSLRALLAERIGTLSATAYSLLSRLAHAEGPTAVETLMPGHEEPARQAAVSELVRLELAERRDDRRLHFPHEVTREIVRRDLGTKGDGSPRHRSRTIAAASVVLLGVAGAAWGVGAMATPPADGPFPEDHSLVLVRQDNVAVRYEFDLGTGALVPVDSTGAGGLDLVSRLTDGRLALSGRVSPSPDRGPDGALRFWGEDQTRIVVANEPDDRLKGLHPNGRFALATTADETGGWRPVAYMLDLETGDTQEVLRPPFPGSAMTILSPLGNRILGATGRGGQWAVVDLAGDTITTLSNDPPGLDAAWCGNDAVLLGSRRPGLPTSYRRHDLLTDEVEDVDIFAPHVSGIACSVDGRHLAWVTLTEGIQRVYVRNLDVGNEVSLDLPLDGVRVQLVPDQAPVVPVELEVPGSVVIAWGHDRPLDVRVLDQRGHELAYPGLGFASRDPGVARMLGSRLVGNRPDTTSIDVLIDGLPWTQIPVRVENVGSQLPAGTRFLDPLDGDFRTDWITIGEPAPVQLDTALRLTGDGNFRDGIVSRSGFGLPGGATVEMEFRLPLTDRRDRQRVSLCLDAGQAAPSEENDGEAWITDERVCTTYPAGELSLFDRGAILVFGSYVALGAIPLPDDLVPSGDWTT